MEKKDKEKVEAKKIIIRSSRQSRIKRRNTFLGKAKILSAYGDHLAFINLTCDGDLQSYTPDMSGLLARFHEFECRRNLVVHEIRQEDQAPKQPDESTSSRQLLAGDISNVGLKKEFQVKQEPSDDPSSLQGNKVQMLKHLLAISEMRRKEVMLENERLTKQVEDLKRSSNTSEQAQPQQVPVAEDITEKQGTSSSNRIYNEVDLDLKLGPPS